MNGMSNCTAEANRKYSAVYIMANSIGKNKLYFWWQHLDSSEKIFVLNSPEANVKS